MFVCFRYPVPKSGMKKSDEKKEFDSEHSMHLFSQISGCVCPRRKRRGVLLRPCRHFPLEAKSFTRRDPCERKPSPRLRLAASPPLHFRRGPPPASHARCGGITRAGHAPLLALVLVTCAAASSHSRSLLPNSVPFVPLFFSFVFRAHSGAFDHSGRRRALVPYIPAALRPGRRHTSRRAPSNKFRLPRSPSVMRPLPTDLHPRFSTVRAPLGYGRPRALPLPQSQSLGRP